ncbi:MAG: hypothetical protein HYW27_03650 [Candidatus Aenigmarchaeota archaeon]|nr:hypothetical protein [Candidatus Aenigmarchaeota archaeon]
MTETTEMDLRKSIYSTFSAVASALGYSEVHGMIISALLVENKSLSLEELAQKTGYSLSSISISLDLLELVGIVRKIKNSGDRKIYVRLEGDLLESLKTAFMLKLKKEMLKTRMEMKKHRIVSKEKGTNQMIATMEKELKRLDTYIDRLAQVQIPGKK